MHFAVTKYYTIIAKIQKWFDRRVVNFVVKICVKIWKLSDPNCRRKQVLKNCLTDERRDG